MNAFKLTILVLTASVSPAFSAGQITFGNNIPGVLVAPIYGVEDGVNDWADAKTGNTPTGIPAGTQTYHGSLLEGWSVGVWAALGTNITSGAQLFPLAALGTIGTGSEAGFFPTTTATIPFFPPTGKATVQVRVWDSQGGTIPVSQAEWGSPGSTAVSALFTVNIGGFASNLRSFSAGWLDPMTFAPPIPEPTTSCLFAIGALLLGPRFARRC
jgi:hypothetical protein